MDEIDTCLVLSNLLENAFEASLHTAPARRQIRITAYVHAERLLLVEVENAFDGEVNEKSGVFCNMLDRLDADPVFLSLGRAEEPAFFVDFTVKCVFHFDQKKPLGMDIRSDPDLAPGGCGAQAGFECVF